MKHDDNLNKQPHWRCRLCGHSTPLGEAVCSNPNCGADLGIYGEAVTPGGEETDRAYRKPQDDEARRQNEEAQWRAEEERQRRENAQQQKAEEQRRKAEEKARKKADKQANRSGGGPKWLLPVLAVVLIAALGTGAAVMFLNRDAADDPTPPRQSADPGPDESQPGQEEGPSSDENQPGEDQPGGEGTPDPNAWRGNILMADPNLGAADKPEEYPAFGGTSQDGLFSGTFTRQDFCSITFMDSLDDMHGSYWDVSQAQDGSVMAWADLTGRDGVWLYDLFIGAEGGVEAPADCSGMFMGYVNVESISFNGAFHTENAVNMDSMFHSCKALESLDVTGFDTSGVTNMQSMFAHCENLGELDVTRFDTSNVTNMNIMFAYCKKLVELDVSRFDTSNVTGMAFMFRSCENLRGLDVSSFDTSGVTNMGDMFCSCFSLQALDVSGFNTSGVTSMRDMFCGCKSLRELDVTGFDTSSVTNMSHMFDGCSGLAELDITNFKTSNVTDMSYMFAGMSSGFALHFVRANFDTSNVETNEGFMDDSFDWKKMFE